MSIYSAVTAHNKQSHGEPIVPEIMYDDPMFKLNTLNEKGTTIAGQPIPTEDLAEYYSDDEEREKALQAQKEKAHTIEKEK